MPTRPHAFLFDIDPTIAVSQAARFDALANFSDRPTPRERSLAIIPLAVLILVIIAGSAVVSAMDGLLPILAIH
jgi:hypothetical protein